MPQRVQLRRTRATSNGALTYVVTACLRCHRPGGKGQQGYCGPECRFWDKVQKTDYCWTWTGAPHSKKGYGRFDAEGVKWLAHRYAYTLLVAPIPPEHELDHVECGNTSCVRPTHVEPVTPKEHARRTDQGAYMRSRTHCPAGHEYTPENTRLDIYESRHCRKCDSPGWGLKGSRNGYARLTEDVVREARQRRVSGERVGDLAIAYGVSQSVMSRAIAGVTWSHV